jgi:Ca-activated chloride channel homolog
MTERDLHSLSGLTTPAPRVAAKERAMSIGMASFAAAQKEWPESFQVPTQGSADPERPTNVTSLKKERSWMRLNPRAYAPIAASIIAMVAAAPFLLRAFDVRPVPVQVAQVPAVQTSAKVALADQAVKKALAAAPAVVVTMAAQGAWIKFCEPVDGKSACLVQHEKIDGNTGMVVVSVALREVANLRQLVVILPLGFDFRSGVALRVDQGDAITMPQAKHCHPDSCTYEAVANQALIERLKSGTMLTVTGVREVPDRIATYEPTTFPVPLAGFAMALAGPPMDNAVYTSQRGTLTRQAAAHQPELYKQYVTKQKADADAKAKPQVLAGVVSDGKSGCGGAATGSPTCTMEVSTESAESKAKAEAKAKVDSARKQMAEAKVAADAARANGRREADQRQFAAALDKSPAAVPVSPPTAAAPQSSPAKPSIPQVALALPAGKSAITNYNTDPRFRGHDALNQAEAAKQAGSSYSGYTPSIGGACPLGRIPVGVTCMLNDGSIVDTRDKFDAPPPNATKSTLTEPVSTFSVDVDTASYALARRQLTAGRLPSAASVRVEEMINYFKYEYRRPESASAPFEPQITVTANPWNPNTKLVHIGLKGYEIKAAERPRANIVLLVDVSGSMGPADRLPMLKTAFGQMLSELKPDDTVAIVTYASGTAVALPPTRVADAGTIRAAIDRLQAGGGTYGAGGLQLAYELATGNFDAKGVNRIILGTDGDWNIGISDKDQLKTFIEAKRKSGIFLSILGVGMGNHNDALMQTLAQNGNGVAAYIDTLSEARKVLVDEISSSLFTIAKDVKIQVEFNPAQVAEYRLVGYETRVLRREDFANDKVDAGDVGSGHAVTAIYEITPVGSPAVALPDLRYGPAKPAEPARVEPVARTAKDGEYGFFKLRYKLPHEEQSRLLELPISKALEKAELGVASDDVRFSIAVAAYGQLLRGHTNLGMTFDDVIALANASRGADPFGLRAEFVNLARAAKAARP